MSRLAVVLFLAGCGRDVERQARAMTGGEPTRGPELALRYGCGTCHDIDGVAGANGKVGPPLDGVASRVYLAGELPNVPANMLRWIEHPHSIHAKTVMPEMGVSDADARDLAAYLYTLR